ncbi:UNVERIFIED_CONTAM: hypothetical protein ACS92_07185 [Bacillus cereus]
MENNVIFIQAKIRKNFFCLPYAKNYFLCIKHAQCVAEIFVDFMAAWWSFSPNAIGNLRRRSAGRGKHWPLVPAKSLCVPKRCVSSKVGGVVRRLLFF